MKKFSWSSLIIGFLSGIGILVVGLVLVSIIAIGFGANPSSLRHGRGLPFLLGGIMYLLLLVVIFGAGYVSSLIARPQGVYNAMILGVVFALLTFSPSLWGIIRMIVAFSLTVMGGMSVKQTT